MKSSVAGVLGMFLAGAVLAADPTLDGTSAQLWKPCTGWVQKIPAKYEVVNDNGSLVFRAEGAGTEMPWIVDLTNSGVTGDERYLLVRYRATGVAASPGVYFLHGEEGSHGGRSFAAADVLKPDGAPHTLAVDLVAIEPAESTRRLAVKVMVGPSGAAKLTIEKIWFADQLAPDAQLAPVPPRRPVQSTTMDWRQATKLAPQTGWVPTPADKFDATLDGSAMTFSVHGHGKGMRWLLPTPEPIDLVKLPYLSLRYRATGQLAPTTYAVWLGGVRTAGKSNSVVPLLAGHLKTDGVWHNLDLKLSAPFAAVQVAIGLDCEGDAARLTLGPLRFASQSRRWSLAESLDYETLSRPPAGKNGFAVGPARVVGGKPSPFLAQRLGLSDWFDAEQVSVGGTPFVVQRDLAALCQTPLAGFGELSLGLPAGVKEIYLLTAAAAPPTEPWGIDWKSPKPQEMLDVPEKVFYEIRYESGPPERVLALDAATGRWGMKRGVSVNVVHPDPSRRATALLLCDRMQTASFAIVGATMRKESPRVAEPNWDRLSAGLRPANSLPSIPQAPPAAATEPAVTAGALCARWDTSQGLRWAQLDVPGLAGSLACEPGPVFQVTVAGRVLPSDQWTVEKTEALGAGRRFLLRHAGAALAATVECTPGDGHQLLLRMKLTNEGKAATNATLRFPMLAGLRLGSAADTWYLCGKRGGLVHWANVSLREPLGERHPLQMDGFFNPASGLALACLTHDTAAQHHFIHFAKTDQGGQWSAEYVQRDLAPGAAFAATEAALVLRAGGWQAILAAYADWLRSWFKPAAPRKDWFEKVFALASGNVHYDAYSLPADRGAVRPLVDQMLKYIGRCDYVHLFGWGASKTHGDWGDYDHYDEIGGRSYFRHNIQDIQQRGIAVSLYLDGYLNCDRARSAGAQAREWAMKHADGSPQYVEQYRAFNECPYAQGWQDHLSRAYRRVRDDLGPKILYIDEYGSTDGRWICRAKDHGHNGYEIPYAGEVAMLKRIREAVGPDVALYTEYPPAEVSRQYLDGSITYQAVWSADQEPLAPHFIDLPRFAFPDFKQFHIIYYVTTRAGNWWLFKFPFFNGEVYRIGVPGLPGMDEPSRAFLRRAVGIQCDHRQAFASRNVRALVPTEVAGVFANQFATAQEIVWTLYNANGRSVGKPVLRVPHVEGARYHDDWNDRPLTPEIRDGQAIISLELGPKSVGCLVQRLP